MSDRIYAASSRAAAPVAPPIQADFLGRSHSTELPFWQALRSRAFWQTARVRGETLLNLWRTSIYLPLAGLGLVTAMVVGTAVFALIDSIEPVVVASGDEPSITRVQNIRTDTSTSLSERPSPLPVVSKMLPDPSDASAGIWSDLAAALSAETVLAHSASEPPVRPISLRRSSDQSAAPVVAPELMEPVIAVDSIPSDETVCNLDSCQGERLETAIIWRSSAEQTFEDAIEQDKLVFMLHVSGNFALPEFT